MSVYKIDDCDRNVYRLIRFLHFAPTFDVTQAHVGYVFHSNHELLTLTPALRYSITLDRSFYHHVVLVYDNRIMDLDFTNRPRVAHPDVYFKEMFGALAQTDRLRIRIVPATDFLRDFDPYEDSGVGRDFEFYVYDPVARMEYPDQSVQEFITNCQIKDINLKTEKSE